MLDEEDDGDTPLVVSGEAMGTSPVAGDGSVEDSGMQVEGARPQRRQRTEGMGAGEESKEGHGTMDGGTAFKAAAAKPVKCIVKVSCLPRGRYFIPYIYILQERIFASGIDPTN